MSHCDSGEAGCNRSDEEFSMYVPLRSIVLAIVFARTVGGDHTEHTLLGMFQVSPCHSSSRSLRTAFTIWPS